MHEGSQGADIEVGCLDLNHQSEYHVMHKQAGSKMSVPLVLGNTVGMSGQSTV